MADALGDYTLWQEAGPCYWLDLGRYIDYETAYAVYEDPIGYVVKPTVEGKPKRGCPEHIDNSWQRGNYGYGL